MTTLEEKMPAEVAVAHNRGAGLWLPTPTESLGLPSSTTMKRDQGAEVTRSPIRISSPDCGTTRVSPAVAVTISA